jgi:hypothetical protein
MALTDALADMYTAAGANGALNAFITKFAPTLGAGTSSVQFVDTSKIWAKN